MRCGLILLVAGAVMATACAPKTYSTDGKDVEQMTKDESQCRAQVRATANNDRNIEDQRRAVFAGDKERYGQQDLYNTMDNQGYKQNVDRMTARCMEARGWAPKGNTWWKKLSW